MQLEILDPDPQLDLSSFDSAARSVFLGEGLACNLVNIIFKSRDSLRQLKQEYFLHLSLQGNF